MCCCCCDLYNYDTGGDYDDNDDDDNDGDDDDNNVLVFCHTSTCVVVVPAANIGPLSSAHTLPFKTLRITMMMMVVMMMICRMEGMLVKKGFPGIPGKTQAYLRNCHPRKQGSEVKAKGLRDVGGLENLKYDKIQISRKAKEKEGCVIFAAV